MSTSVLSRSSFSSLIPPHGGKLVTRICSTARRSDVLRDNRDLLHIQLDRRSLSDLECIATGVYSPLTGFLAEQDYVSVVDRMRLHSGLVWPVPVTLGVNEQTARDIRVGDHVALEYGGRALAVMSVQDIYQPDKEAEARQVYRTLDRSHPGVRALFDAGEVYIGGDVELMGEIPHSRFHRYRLKPRETRDYFRRHEWETVVAFQTRNPIHRAHEYLQKVALEMVDGLLVSPLVGATKDHDIPADVRMRTYEVVLDKYYPKERTLLGVFPAYMRYAGPREAVMHAIARKNYGCTHFIVGRDHAGVGGYYGTYDAQAIFDEFTADELGIQVLKFEHAFYCKKCGHMVTSKVCPHTEEDWVHLSGTKVRSLLQQGRRLPVEFTRPEVSKILAEAYGTASLENHVSSPAREQGITVWFTGLSGSGKTTISQAVANQLTALGYKVEILDGDVIRQNLTKGLGFTKEDRDENIRRIGFVANLLARNGVIVLVAAISPYRATRQEVRERIGNFMEVYVNAPLEICEERDVKGLYARARAGEIENFTGVDDPYEEPENPEVECHTDVETVSESVEKVLEALEGALLLNDLLRTHRVTESVVS